MRKTVVGVTAVGLALLFVTASWGFWSIGIPVHGDITKEALSGQFSFNSLTYSFTPHAIAQIVKENRNQDLPPLNIYAPEDHFDSALLKYSTNVLLERIADLESTLQNENGPNPNIVSHYVGAIMHAAQDFYAHSSWVANGHTSIVNFYNPSLVGPPTYAAFTDNSTAAVCNDPATLLTNGALPITTGFYDTPLPLQPGQCDHGWRSYTTQMAADALAGSCDFALTKDGINHDNACFDADDDVRIFESAYQLAVQETTSILTAVIHDLESDGNTIGFCLLLGLDETRAPCNFSATVNTTAQSLQIGTAMTPFSPLTASGGYLPYTYSYSGTLPEGLFFNSTTGVVSGTPKSVYPTSSIIFDVRDSAGDVTNAKTTSTVAFTVADGQCPASLTTDLTTVANAFPFYLPQPSGFCFSPSKFTLYTNALKALPEYSIPSCVSIIDSLIASQSNVPPNPALLPVCP